MAEGARKEISLDEILWIPNVVSPHKEDDETVSPQDRYRMVELAIESNSSFRVSRIEIDRQAPSYTIDTVRQLREKSPETEWTFLIGADAAAELPSWREFDELIQLIEFAVIPRPGQAVVKCPDRVRSIAVDTLDISASEIRQRVRDGRSIRTLVPEAVCEYIEEKGLYR